AAMDAQLALGGNVLGVALDRHNVDGIRLVRVDGDREAEVGRQVPADLVPRLAAVVAAHDVPVLLHEQRVRPGRVHREAVDAVAHLPLLVRPPSVERKSAASSTPANTVSGSVSEGSRCHTRANSQGCCVPSYHWCVPGTPSYVNSLPTGSQVLPPSSERWTTWPCQPVDC